MRRTFSGIVVSRIAAWTPLPQAASGPAELPFLIQFGFTLALHDRPGDLLHALAGVERARRNRRRDPALLFGGE